MQVDRRRWARAGVRVRMDFGEMEEADLRGSFFSHYLNKFFLFSNVILTV